MLGFYPFSNKALSELLDSQEEFVATPFRALLDNPSAKRRFLVELFPADASVTASTFLSTDGFISDASATVANTLFAPRVRQPLLFSRSLRSGGRFSGAVRANGEIVLENSDGGLDTTIGTYAIDGRQVRTKMGDDTFRYDDFGTIFDGTAAQWVFDQQTVRLPLRDNIFKLQKPIQTTFFTGSATDGGDNLMGKPLPICFGQVFHITPPLKDPSGLVFQVHDGAIASIVAVYDREVQLSTGQYTVNASAGTFTLLAAPAGLVTADVQGDATPTYISTTADIVDRIVQTRASVSTDNIDSASFDVVAGENTATVGVWIGTEPRDISDVVDELMTGIGGFYGFSRTGKLQIGVFKAPKGAAKAELTDQHIIRIERLALPESISPPNWRRQVGYQKNYTIVTQDFAGSVTDDRKQFVAEEYRIAVAEASTIKDKHLLATDPEVVPALFTTAAAASTEADRLLTLYKQDRNLYSVTIKVGGFDIDIGNVIKITLNRWDLTTGKLFRVVSVRDDAANNSIELEVFG